MTTSTGPLSGIRVLEFEALGPGPFCGMLLADMGADVLLVDRPHDPGLGFPRERRHDAMLRGRRSVTLDLKSPAGADAARRPGHARRRARRGFRRASWKRLGLGPEALFARNPARLRPHDGLGAGRAARRRAGHDIDYIALTGALHAIGRAGDAPVPPLNLVGDFGGGGMLLAFGIACALLDAQRSGRGQVVDAAMVDGAALLTTMFWGMRAAGQWSDARGENVLDSGAPWYDAYRTSDGAFVAVGAIEDKFYAELLQRLGLAADTLPAQHDRARWPELRARLAAAFVTRTRDEWARAFAGSDACVAPVLTFAEAPAHPHAHARGAYVNVGGVPQPAPAPRFSRTPGAVRGAPPERGAGGHAALRDWGFDDAAIAELRAAGVGCSG